MAMRGFTLQGLMWMEEGIGWLKERNGGMTKEGGFAHRIGSDFGYLQ